MKKIAAMLLALVCTVLAGCAEESAYHPIEPDNVSVEVYDITPTGATVVITDTNASPVTYGGWFVIERERHGRWYGVEPLVESFSFHCIGYTPDSNDEVRFTIPWRMLYGELPAGHYRILKEYGEKYIAGEFSIE